MEAGPSRGYGSGEFSPTDAEPSYRDFVLGWISANAIGIGLGWPMAEYVGGLAAGSLGGEAALILAMLVYETILWSLRATVFARFGSAGVVKRIDAAIMIFTELFGVVLGGFLHNGANIPEGSLLKFTTGSYLAVTYGSFVWALLWLIRVQARRPKIKLPLGRALLGSAFRITASLIVFASFVIVPVLCQDVGYWVARSVGPYYGMGAEGFMLGIYVGALSAMAMPRFLAPASV